MQIWIKKTFAIGYKSVGFGAALDFDTVDDVILKWIEKRTFEAKKLQNEYVQSKLTDYLHSYIKDGKTYNDFRTNIDKMLEKTGVTELKPWHVETIFRTEGQTALNYGRWNSMQAAVDVAPYWQYVYVDDGNHEEGTICFDIAAKHKAFVRPADDPIWLSIYPPNHYNCRSGVIALTKEVMKRDNIIVSRKWKGDMPEEGFDGTQWNWKQAA